MMKGMHFFPFLSFFSFAALIMCKIDQTCTIRGSYGYDRRGERELACKRHKRDDMVIASYSSCHYEECDKNASFAYPGKPRSEGFFCKEHAPEGTIGIKGVFCIAKDMNGTKCTRQATKNFEGKKNQFCSEHAMEGMKDTKHKKCFCGYSLGPQYAFPGSDKATHCAKCKEHFMVDILTKRCPCARQIKKPIYGYPGQPLQAQKYCKSCKQADMVDITNAKCLGNCGKTPNYGFESDTLATYCVTCKAPGMIDIRNRSCKTEGCYTLATKDKFKDYCFRCYVRLNPDDPISRNYKNKERQVQEFIETIPELANYHVTFDKRIDGGCSTRRPDVHIECFTHR